MDSPFLTQVSGTLQSDKATLHSCKLRNPSVLFLKHIAYNNHCSDGQQGILKFRQFDVGYLFAHHDYEDVVHLLVWESLPSPAMKAKFRARIAKHMSPPDSVKHTIQSFAPKAPAFLIVAAGLSAWAAAQPEKIPVTRGRSIYHDNNEEVEEGIYRSLAAFATVVAMTYCHQKGTAFTERIDISLSTIENMLIMMGRVNSFGEANADDVRVLNKIWILFADHEMSNSTAAFLHAASTLGDPLSACVASIASGNGPLHGGAIDLTYQQFKSMGSREGARRYMADVRQQKCRLMGVGHRVYNTVDPRIQYLKSLMATLKPALAQNILLDIAMEVESIVAVDSYFTSRNLSINADMYGSFVYAAL
jgi:citrate synthase